MTDPNVNDTLLAGVQYPAADRIFFARGVMAPPYKENPIAPQDLDVHVIKGIYWDGVPPFPKQEGKHGNWGTRKSHSFTSKFLISPMYKPGEVVDLFPGACLTHPNGVHYCCQAASVKVRFRGFSGIL